ncbi:MAG: hypothetical protein Q8M31_16335 [Beijerinckiaceae bacterium]|nr:hypothetical protein [Beijerinckiaceae bacterium]
MSKRSLASRVYTPEELDVLCKAFRRACVECDLTGPSGRAFLARALMTRFKSGITKEDDLVDIARIIVWRRRGLDGLRVVASQQAKPKARPDALLSKF